MDIRHRFDRGFRPAKQATVFVKDGRLYQKDAPEGAEEVRAAKLLDTGFYDELFMIETDDDYWAYVVSVSAVTETGEPIRRTYCVFGVGAGDAITYAYYLMWTEGGRKNFLVNAIGEAEQISEDCPEYTVTWLATPKLPVYKMLEKLSGRNARFISELIDQVYRMTEDELLRYEKETLPEQQRYVGSPTPATEDELIKRMRDNIYYDRTAWETNMPEGTILREWLLDLVDKAKTNEEKKRWLNMFILLPYGTYFLTTAYKTVLNEALPDIGELPS